MNAKKENKIIVGGKYFKINSLLQFTEVK